MNIPPLPPDLVFPALAHTPADLSFSFEVKRAAIGPYVERRWGWDEDYQLLVHRQHFAIAVSDRSPPRCARVYPARISVFIRWTGQRGCLTERPRYLVGWTAISAQSCCSILKRLNASDHLSSQGKQHGEHEVGVQGHRAPLLDFGPCTCSGGCTGVSCGADSLDGCRNGSRSHPVRSPSGRTTGGP
jgi:hypothetical protein